MIVDWSPKIIFTFKSANLSCIHILPHPGYTCPCGRHGMYARSLICHQRGFFRPKKCKLIGYLTSEHHTLVRHVHVGGSSLSVMFRVVDPDMYTLVNDKTRNVQIQCPRFKPEHPLVRFLRTLLFCAICIQEQRRTCLPAYLRPQRRLHDSRLTRL